MVDGIFSPDHFFTKFQSLSIFFVLFNKTLHLFLRELTPRVILNKEVLG